MVLGFILPFALAFVAIPLESLVYSTRTVAGVLLIVPVRAAAFVLRIAAHVARHAGRVLISLYDVAIVVPLLAERLAKNTLPRPASRTEPDVEEAAAERRL
jgi:hypothetical protein